jgi:hypothetical protein
LRPTFIAIHPDCEPGLAPLALSDVRRIIDIAKNFATRTAGKIIFIRLFDPDSDKTGLEASDLGVRII